MYMDDFYFFNSHFLNILIVYFLISMLYFFPWHYLDGHLKFKLLVIMDVFYLKFYFVGLS